MNELKIKVVMEVKMVGVSSRPPPFPLCALLHSASCVKGEGETDASVLEHTIV